MIFVSTILNARFCKGCRSTLPLAEFDVSGGDLHRGCKHIRDQVYTIAKNQGCVVIMCLLQISMSVVWCVPACLSSMIIFTGELQWFNEARSDDDKLFYILQHYRKHRQVVQAGVCSVTKWQVGQCKALVIKMFSVEVNDMGELLCRRRFCVWASDRAS